MGSTIFVIDSSPAVHRMVEQISAPEGHKVMGFSDGPSALDAARKLSPALVIADYYAHIGGFLTGLLLGAWVPVDPAGDRLLEPQVEEAEAGYAAGDSAAGAQPPTLPR